MRDDIAILNLSDPAIRKLVIDHVRQCRGLYSFQLKRCRNQRSLQQNAWYWGCVLKHVQAGIEEAWGERKSVEWCHAYMKKLFRTEPVINRKTGEQVDETVGSTADLDTAAFGEYVEQVRQWASENLNVDIPDPDPQWFRKEGKDAA